MSKDDDLVVKRFEWEKSQKQLDRELEIEKLDLENSKSRWDRNPILKAVLPVSLAVIALGQLYLALTEFTAKRGAGDSGR